MVERDLNPNRGTLVILTWTGSRHEVVNRAHDFARRAHFGQTRQGSSTPYIRHPEEVASIVSSWWDNPEDIAAALLHDVPEDTGFNLRNIREKFGEYVQTTVSWLTNPAYFSELNPVDKKTQQAIHIRMASRGAQIIKLADMISNLRSLRYDPPLDWSRRRRFEYIAGTLHLAKECRPSLEILYLEFLRAHREAYEATERAIIFTT